VCFMRHSVSLLHLLSRSTHVTLIGPRCDGFLFVIRNCGVWIDRIHKGGQGAAAASGEPLDLRLTAVPQTRITTAIALRHTNGGG
jgi:hypothetical protein